MAKFFLKKLLLIFVILLCTVSFALQVSAISISIGDPVEVFNLWTNIRNKVNIEYNQLKKEIDKRRAVNAEVRFNNILALVKELDTLSQKFTAITRFRDENTLAIIYPNGGETFDCGKNHTIVWNTEITPSQTRIDSLINPTFGIYLSKKDEFGGRYIVDTIVDELTTKNKKYNWSVPCDIRSGSYLIMIRANPDLKITSFEDTSDASFNIISTTANAVIDSLSIDKTSISSGENININWSGNNVREYKLYFGTEFGTGATMKGKGVGAQSVPMELQTSASFNYTNITDTPKKVFILLEAYGIHESRDSFKQIEITVNPL